ncbi:MAG: hypothetical protein QOJ65_864, partial [Fimbriimonadaceae bacterium]|nr:hypothetical protein [Fimbriimonadaceae bacterium]
MILIAVHLGAVLATHAFTSHPQRASSPLKTIARQSKRGRSPSEAASVRRFVQDFYDWYIPMENRRDEARLNKVKLHKKDQADEMPDEIVAINSRPEMFSRELRHALLEDRKAQEKNSDYIVGIDFDPFTDAQDIANHGLAGRAEHKGHYWLVHV